MSKTFTFSSLNKMGEFHDEYGQTYWGNVNEQLQPVMFNSKDQNITVDDRITADTIELKQGKKGEYHRLRKVAVEHGHRAAQAPVESSDEVLELVRDNNRILKQLAGESEEKKPDYDEPVNLDEIPF